MTRLLVRFQQYHRILTTLAIRMGKMPSEIMAMPADDRDLLMAAIVDEQKRQADLISNLGESGKLTPEAYALLTKDLLI